MKSALLFLALVSATTLFGANVIDDFDYALTPWKTRADEWRGSGEKPTRITDWSGYDRLTFDIVNFGIGGENVCLFLKGSARQTGLVQFRSPCLAARNYEISLESFAKAGAALTNVTAISFSARWAMSFNTHIYNVRLLKKDEKTEEAKLPEPYKAKLAEHRAVWKAERMRAHQISFLRWRAACQCAGTVKKGAIFGQASSMTRICPREEFTASPATSLGVRLARNEKESVQLLVAPDGADMADVFVAPVGFDGFDPANISCAPMGYVALRRVPEPVARMTLDPAAPRRHVATQVTPGWHPDPILDFLKTVDIRGNDVQSFWVKVRSAENQRAGTYRGALRVSWRAKGKMLSHDVPFTIRVYDFAIGKASPIPLSMSFKPGFFVRNYNRLDRIVGTDYYEVERWIHAHTNCAPYLARKRTHDWAQFLADNLVTIDFLYPAVGPRWGELVQLKKEGRLDTFNLKYWNHVSGNERWFAEARERYEKAKELGLLDHACFYGADELGKELFPTLQEIGARIKREFPGVPLVSTLKDNTYSLPCVDVFVPVCGAYVATNAVKARAAGKRVGWYVCGGGDGPRPEFFFGRDAIEPRLLTSAPAVKFNCQWFLYYELAGWSSIEPITGGPFTKWSPEGFCDYVGDGNIVACGPGGMPLSTQRFENFRDGLEDLWYARLYKERFGRDPEVPDALGADLNHLSHDPALLQAWRDNLAEQLEKKEK